METFLDGRVTMHAGDSRQIVAGLPEASVDSVVTDPPYALVSIVKRFGKPGSAPVRDSDVYARSSAGFMGKAWDTGETAFDPAFWTDILRVLKPGGHILAFGGTRTYHRLACAIEDAGFEIRDQVLWLYGSGFPKSHNVARAIDKAKGATGEIVERGEPVKRMIPGADQHKDGWEKTDGRIYQPGDYAPASDEARNWQGWGTALKPAVEPVVMARKPFVGTIADTVTRNGTGALNIDGARIGARTASTGEVISENVAMGGPNYGRVETGEITIGRWPANVIHDGSDEVVSGFPDSDGSRIETPCDRTFNAFAGGGLGGPRGPRGFDDSGSAARFFYTAKADADDRLGSKHPTVKPVDLMQYLCRLVTPPGGVVLDPFAGTGTTGEAAWREGFFAILIEREAEYQADIARRMALAASGRGTRRAASAKARAAGKADDAGPLFGGTPTVAGGGRQIYGHFADQDERLARSGSSGEGG